MAQDTPFFASLPSWPWLLSDWSSAMHPHLHFHARAEPVDDGHEAMHSEPPKIRIAYAREAGSRTAGPIMRRAPVAVVVALGAGVPCAGVRVGADCERARAPGCRMTARSFRCAAFWCSVLWAGPRAA